MAPSPLGCTLLSSIPSNGCTSFYQNFRSAERDERGVVSTSRATIGWNQKYIKTDVSSQWLADGQVTPSACGRRHSSAGARSSTVCTSQHVAICKLLPKYWNAERWTGLDRRSLCLPIFRIFWPMVVQVIWTRRIQIIRYLYILHVFIWDTRFH